MAAPDSIAIRRARAMDRIEATTATLARRFDLSLDPASLRAHGRDPDLARANQLVAFADVLDRIATATTPSVKEKQDAR